MIRSILKPIYYAIKSRSFTRMSRDPFATHLPILVGLCYFYNVKSVLEFGSGENSTLAFLDRSSFPKLEKLCSVENYQEWYEIVKKKLPDDNRINYIFHSGPMCDATSKVDVDQYDLIFIDDSIDSRNRSMTICEVLKKSPKIVVVHDFENYSYQRAVSKFGKYYRFNALLPNTGVYIKNEDRGVLRKLNLIIEKNKDKIVESDTRSWKECFIREGLNNV